MRKLVRSFRSIFDNNDFDSIDKEKILSANRIIIEMRYTSEQSYNKVLILNNFVNMFLFMEELDLVMMKNTYSSTIIPILDELEEVLSDEKMLYNKYIDDLWIAKDYLQDETIKDKLIIRIKDILESVRVMTVISRDMYFIAKSVICIMLDILEGKTDFKIQYSEILDKLEVLKKNKWNS